MALIVSLKILLILFLFLPKNAISYEFLSIGDEQMSFIIDICKLYGSKSAIFIYSESIKEMEMTMMIFKWRRALSWEGIATANLYFSQLHRSSYHLKQTIRPYYIAVISNYNAINEFSLATSTFYISSAVWLVIFIYEEIQKKRLGLEQLQNYMQDVLTVLFQIFLLSVTNCMLYPVLKSNNFLVIRESEKFGIK